MLMSTIQIVLVDDHRLFRGGIASLINNFSGYKILFEAANGTELIKKITENNKPDIIILDINMPVMNGLNTAEWLRKNHPGIKIIVLSMYDDAEKVLTMLKLGVKGYLLKDAEPVEFKNALEKVSAGDVYFPDFVSRLLVNSFNDLREYEKLNIREIEFLKLVGTELTYRQIADKMQVSVRTVDGYRDHLFEKLQIKSRVGLALYAVKNRMVDL